MSPFLFELIYNVAFFLIWSFVSTRILESEGADASLSNPNWWILYGGGVAMFIVGDIGRIFKLAKEAQYELDESDY